MKTNVISRIEKMCGCKAQDILAIISTDRDTLIVYYESESEKVVKKIEIDAK